MFWTDKSLWEGRIADALSNDRTCQQWQEREDANDFPVKATIILYLLYM